MIEEEGQLVSAIEVGTAVTGNRLKGMRLRDEFICPITCELMREPTIASDGFTYEKNAIERWFHSKPVSVSPRTGQSIDNSILIPNMNLKKLIRDMIAEGGAGLYTRDASSESRYIDVSPVKVLTLRCLGPPESDWFMKTFDVTVNGCIGGRKNQTEAAANSKDMIIFKDSTVSRKHFEFAYSHELRKYVVRDLGSAGGTFVRIRFGEKKELHPGMMILIGKHQFNVSSISDSIDSSLPLESPRRNPEAFKSLLSDAERLIADYGKIRDENEAETEIERRLRDLTTRLSNLDIEELHGTDYIGARSGSASAAEAKIQVEDSKEEFLSLARAESKGGFGIHHHGGKEDDSKEREFARSPKSSKQCVLTCFLPDGSPMQGKTFVVGSQGATVGRRQSNLISLYLKVEEDGEEKIVNIDGAVSAEHARIDYNQSTGQFFIQDGTTRPSTNGTWVRISGPHQESPFIPVSSDDEILIGTVRFQLCESMTILEKTIDDV